METFTHRALRLVHVRTFLAEHSVLLLFVILAIGTVVGQIARGISIGPAAVPSRLSDFGLAQDLAPRSPGHLRAGALCVLWGWSPGRSSPRCARGQTGVRGLRDPRGRGRARRRARARPRLRRRDGRRFVCRRHQHPALAAAIERPEGAPEPTVAYSMTYVLGVAFLLAAAAWGIRQPSRESDDETGPGADRQRDDQGHPRQPLTVSELTGHPTAGALSHDTRWVTGDRHHTGTRFCRPGDRVPGLSVRRWRSSTPSKQPGGARVCAWTRSGTMSISGGSYCRRSGLRSDGGRPRSLEHLRGSAHGAKGRPRLRDRRFRPAGRRPDPRRRTP